MYMYFLGSLPMLAASHPHVFYRCQCRPRASNSQHRPALWSYHHEKSHRKGGRKNHLKPTLKMAGWWFEPLWKIWKSIGMMTFPIYGKIKNVPNHQPEMVMSKMNACRHVQSNMRWADIDHIKKNTSRCGSKNGNWLFWGDGPYMDTVASKMESSSWDLLVGIWGFPKIEVPLHHPAMMFGFS